MKQLLWVLLLVAVCSACGDSGEPNSSSDKGSAPEKGEEITGDTVMAKRIHALFDSDEVFMGIRAYEKYRDVLPTTDRLVFEAISRAFQNRPDESNAAIETLLDSHMPHLSSTQERDLLFLKIQNHANLGQFDMAAKFNNQVYEGYENIMTEAQKSDVVNAADIWKALSNEGPTLVSQKAHTVIELVDGYKIPSKINNAGTVNMLFDTGANLSMLIASHADALGVRYMEGSCSFKNVVGQDVEARLGVCDQLAFGNVVVEQVVFLIVPDKELYFADANLQINGIIGFPVMNALKEIHITKDKRIIIPETPSTNAHSNLTLDFLTPVIELVAEGDSLPFSFDFGASHTWLYPAYFERYRDRVEPDYEITSLIMGGVGGHDEFDGYRIDLTVVVDNKPKDLKGAPLLPEKVTEEDHKYYGNLGQDVIGAFDKVVINLDDMFVKLEGE